MDKVKIMVVDDSRVSQAMLEGILKKAGFDVCAIASNAAETVEKYKETKMEAGTQYKQVCREATASFGGRVDSFLKMYQERLKAKKNPKLTKTLNLIYEKTNLRINLEDQKNFFKVCELAANEKK